MNGSPSEAALRGPVWHGPVWHGSGGAVATWPEEERGHVARGGESAIGAS